MKIDLFPIQQQFVDSDAWYVGFLADRGAGKTTAGAVKAIKKILKGEGGIVAARNYRYLVNCVFPALERWLPEELLPFEFRATRNQVRFDVNGKAVVVHCVPISEHKWRGISGGSWLWLDGVEGVERRDLDMLCSRIVHSANPQTWITATDPEGPHWLDDVFLRGPLPEGKTDRSLGLRKRWFSDCFPATPQYSMMNVSPEHRALIEELYPALIQDIDRRET